MKWKDNARAASIQKFEMSYDKSIQKILHRRNPHVQKTVYLMWINEDIVA